MIFDEFKHQLPDADPSETKEWMESLDALVEHKGRTRGQFVLYKLLKRARMLALGLPPTTQTRYINTISPEQEPPYPGDAKLELRLRRLIRWNAAVMVIRGNKHYPGLGGHLATYASCATLYEVGFNHFFQGKDGDSTGDHIFFQGHSSPGVYARAFLEGRISEAELEHFRREVGGKGLSSYPHPRLMPTFWEFPTVSMGLGPINAIYQARFNRYLHARGIANTSRSKVWAFVGDGETDEPETLGALSLAAREGLDNLVFVVNCNLQRLDGPVRGNGKIIQELESVFRGAGWNVIKLIWANEWDKLLARDVDGVLVEKMNETLDGSYQRFEAAPGAVIREEFFGPDPRLGKLVEDYTDIQLERLRRGGHDINKVYAAFRAATEHTGGPTVVLAKTVKGWALGDKIEGRNVAHQAKKVTEDELKTFRDRLELPIPDAQLADPPYFHPGPDSDEIQYLLERRKALGGGIPVRKVIPVAIDLPEPDVYAEFSKGSGATPVSTTMAFVGLLRKLAKHKEFGRRVVPIIPDEGRTFGMEAMFREFKIYAAMGQKYTPIDAKALLSYTEGKDGQLIEEGITEAGSLATFTAAGTAYATHRQPMIPFFIFYSMFGFQRVSDLIWAFGDARGRGFLMGATAGRTTLNGEGLQHQDGHSPLLASTHPSCVCYDAGFAYELSVIIQEGMRRMWGGAGEDVFFYITVYNENYVMPPMPEGEHVREGILRGLYRYRPAPKPGRYRAQLIGSGPILPLALKAQEMLAEKYDVGADVWSATSYGELRRDGLECDRWNRLHPDQKPRVPYVTRVLKDTEGPIVASSDYMKAVPGMIRGWVPRDYTVLGTDGYGRSDTRAALRRFYEIDAESMVVATLSALAREKQIAPTTAVRAMAEFGIDRDAGNPAGR
ncbi:MAG: pyruvate dehydrogenase (acetyl-transferring), homodimeric type [Planctomycetes bacterium]|nr:pyruvate dehydrogenase (acetyl-transferring), homodimeric type [Planctomycetota bacterium]